MNWAGSLGAGPGLLVLETPRSLVEITLAHMPPIPGTCCKRSRAESAACRVRIKMALALDEDRNLIAEREGVSRAWVDAIARRIGKGFPRLSATELAGIAAKARQLYAADPHMKTKEVAAACGVTPSNLCNILRRYP